ncbi:unnamed protein product [Tetraodon nigroviridis]|uniref:(spotted green pufferfish) hypothetical protein n=1 Tax=Tetraodon nigroviridis TaxID=99883 RepID=Q4RY90_TETNG|nr:unnamed protein product [Tetraodon nigroviridis]
MKFPLEVLSLFLLVSGTLTQDLSLSDALGDDDDVAPTPGKPKVPIKPKDDFGLSLEDALGPDPVPKPEKPAAPPPNPGGGDGLDLSDALGPDEQPKKPAEDKPKAGGGGGTFDDSDLFNVGQGDYKPEGGRSGSTGQDTRGTGGADQPQDADLLWGQILKMLNSNMPEEFYLWMSNLKQTVEPLLERALELLQI